MALENNVMDVVKGLQNLTESDSLEVDYIDYQLFYVFIPWNNGGTFDTVDSVDLMARELDCAFEYKLRGKELYPKGIKMIFSY